MSRPRISRIAVDRNPTRVDQVAAEILRAEHPRHAISPSPCCPFCATSEARLEASAGFVWADPPPRRRGRPRGSGGVIRELEESIERLKAHPDRWARLERVASASVARVHVYRLRDRIPSRHLELVTRGCDLYGRWRSGAP